ncbi:hypothetical protein BDY19DRAFT_590783 [Irpex rosettiformis]|uniref:Uncharacterized protein n=1 Tax=Irpex rosettiformis TaxID=378272 RepID=A0ACB8UD71_9APHY|nr:hypothetical protein BDY19DRAFT_590783 [Irpex rosettiformis]
MASLAASIPPELFKGILLYVGDWGRLRPREDPTVRREEMKHLSACALTCVYWAQLTRGRMFKRLALRSPKDLCGLRSFLRASSSGRLPSIGELLRELVIFYKLGDIPWFHNVPGLVASGGYYLGLVHFHVLGPVPPAITAGNTRWSILHPLFFAVPRVLPMNSFHKLDVSVHVENIHFFYPTMLRNLLHDCNLLGPSFIYCTNLTWDHETNLIWDHDPTVPPSSLDWTLTHHSHLRIMRSSQCTDNSRAAFMALSVPRHESSRRLHLNRTDSSALIDIIRTSWGQDTSAGFGIKSISGFDGVQECSAAILAKDCDFAFDWWQNYIEFFCIASRRLGDDSNARFPTYIIIEPFRDDLTKFRNHIRTVDWGAFQKFSDLRGVVIQCGSWIDAEEWRKCLAELVSLLREAWAGVDTLLQLFYGRRTVDYKLTQIKLSTVLDDIVRMREEVVIHSSSSPDSAPELESGPPTDQHDRNPTCDPKH